MVNFPPVFKIIKSLAQKIEFDKAVLYGILSKGWSIIVGPINALLISTHFSSSVQGYYYTFTTILALQVFVELGLGVVIQQFASHEWAKLYIGKDGKIEGDKDSLSRLISIARLSLRWFAVGGLIIAVGLLIGGYFFFSSSSNYNVSWLWPWIFLSSLTGFSVFFVPFWSILEGCYQVRTLYTFRFFLGVISSASFWISMLLGAGLWTAVIGTIVTILASFIFLRMKYWTFFRTLMLSNPSGPKIMWKTNMFPMQWRVAVSWISGYFCFNLFTPILFKFQGPTVAGQFGMTWSIVSAIGGVASAWLSPRMPQFAILIAQKNYIVLDKLFWKIVKIIFCIILGLSVLTFIFIQILPHLNIKLATKLSLRLLPSRAVAFLLIAQISQVLSTPFSAYMRAHKKEPLMYVTILNGLLIGVTTYFMGKYYSVIEVALGYLVVNFVVNPIVILIWNGFRKRHVMLSTKTQEI